MKEQLHPSKQTTITQKLSYHEFNITSTCRTKSQNWEDDMEHCNIISQILQNKYFHSRTKHVRIKLESWINHLRKKQYNKVWKRNKLKYLKLLNLMCQCECIVPPFSSFPDINSLPVLKTHEINKIIDDVERGVKSTITNAKRKNSMIYLNGNREIIGNHSDLNKQRQKKQLNEENINTSSNQHLQDITCQSSKKKREKKETKEDQCLQKDENYSIHKIRNESISAQISKSLKTASKKANHQMKRTPLTINPNYFNSPVQEYHIKLSKSKTSRSNSLLQSINLEISPVAVSYQIRQFANSRKKEQMNKSFDITHLIRQNIKLCTKRSLEDLDDDSSKGFTKNHLKRLKHGLIKRQNREYWQSSSFTGNATPKYLYHNQNPISLSIAESMQETNRSSERVCSCMSFLWGL